MIESYHRDGRYLVCDCCKQRTRVRDELAHGRGCQAVKGISGLSKREREVAVLAAAGKSVRQTAEELGIAYATVESHRYNIWSKLGVRSTPELIALVIRDQERTAKIERRAIFQAWFRRFWGRVLDSNQ